MSINAFTVRQKQKQTELSSSIAFDFLKDNSGGGEEKVKIARVRRSSYMNLSQTKSPLLVSESKDKELGYHFRVF